MISEGAVNVTPLAQVTVESDPHAPERSCIPGLIKFAPVAPGLLNVIDLNS